MVDAPNHVRKLILHLHKGVQTIGNALDILPCLAKLMFIVLSVLPIKPVVHAVINVHHVMLRVVVIVKTLLIQLVVRRTVLLVRLALFDPL